jgi:hypothetical protein
MNAEKSEAMRVESCYKGKMIDETEFGHKEVIAERPHMLSFIKVRAVPFVLVKVDDREKECNCGFEGLKKDFWDENGASSLFHNRCDLF